MVGDQLEMLRRLVHLLALGLTALVVRPAHALAASGQLVYEILLLSNLVILQFEDACLGAVRQQHTGALLSIQHGRQRLQVKAPADGDLRLQQLGRDVELAPEPLLTTGEDGFRLATVAMQRIHHAADLLQVAASGAVLALLFRFAQGGPNQVFHQDGFLPVRFIERRRRLIVKRNRAALRRLEVSKFSDVIACDHSVLLCRGCWSMTRRGLRRSPRDQALLEYSRSLSLRGSLMGKARCRCSPARRMAARTSSTLRFSMSAISWRVKPSTV